MTELTVEQRIIDFREKARRGEPLTKDELREALVILRNQRMAAATQAKSTKSAPRPTEDLLKLFNTPQAQAQAPK